jgi:enamine deaminase RidA (YjgF/YER057c/UK114 family)
MGKLVARTIEAILKFKNVVKSEVYFKDMQKFH